VDKKNPAIWRGLINNYFFYVFRFVIHIKQKKSPAKPGKKPFLAVFFKRSQLS